MPTITVAVNQTAPSTAVGIIRDHQVTIDRPTAKGGADAGPMGGELLLAALGGCFISNLLAAIRAREADIQDVQISVAGELVDAPSRFSAITMTVSATHNDPALLQKLITISERACIVANSLKNSVDLTITTA